MTTTFDDPAEWSSVVIVEAYQASCMRCGWFQTFMSRDTAAAWAEQHERQCSHPSTGWSR